MAKVDPSLARRSYKAGVMSVHLEGDFFKFLKKVDPKNFKKTWKIIKKKALDKTGEYLEGQTRKIIKSGATLANSQLTQILKGSSTPLVETGAFVKDLTHVVSKDSVEIGWKRGGTKYRRASRSVKNTGDLAYEIHSQPRGRTFKITKAMRTRLFRYWAWKTKGKNLPKTSSGFIYVPRRAPLDMVYDSKRKIDKAEKIFRKVARKGLAKYFK